MIEASVAFLLVAGTTVLAVDVGRTLWVYNEMSNIAREASRAAMQLGPDFSDINPVIEDYVIDQLIPNSILADYAGTPGVLENLTMGVHFIDGVGLGGDIGSDGLGPGDTVRFGMSLELGSSAGQFNPWVLTGQPYLTAAYTYQHVYPVQGSNYNSCGNYPTGIPEADRPADCSGSPSSAPPDPSPPTPGASPFAGTTRYVKALSSDAHIYGFSWADYKARGTASGFIDEGFGATELFFGQANYSGNFVVYRLYLEFDTTSLIGCDVGAVRLRMLNRPTASVGGAVVLKGWAGRIHQLDFDFSLVDESNKESNYDNAVSTTTLPLPWQYVAGWPSKNSINLELNPEDNTTYFSQYFDATGVTYLLDQIDAGEPARYAVVADHDVAGETVGINVIKYATVWSTQLNCVCAYDEETGEPINCSSPPDCGAPHLVVDCLDEPQPG